MAPHGSTPRVGENQVPHGARDPDVTESTLLFEFVVVRERSAMREDRLFEAGDDDRRELETLGDVQRHHRDRAGTAVELVGVRDQRHALDEVHQRVVLTRGRGEFPEVLQPRVGLVGVLGAQRVAHARLAHDRVDDLARREVVRERAQFIEHERELLRTAERPTGEAGLLGVVRRLGEGESVLRGVHAELGLGRLADAALGLVDHAPGRGLVAGVDDQSREGQRVLDLLAVVEAHARR